MPFAQHFPVNFTTPSVRQYAPTASGVYGLSNRREWIYIGETDNIRAALLTHLGESDSDMSRSQPKGFVFEVCDQAGRCERQVSLVREYQPSLNRQGLRQR
jgi:hypothetical protein